MQKELKKQNKKKQNGSREKREKYMMEWERNFPCGFCVFLFCSILLCCFIIADLASFRASSQPIFKDSG